jgi:hypothetical protein
MRILIAGGSGLIGRQLSSLLTASGDEVTVLSRNPAQVRGMPVGVAILPWNGRTIEEWANEINRTDVIVNLTGENLSGKGFPPSRWTAERKGRLVQSRTDSGKVLSQVIQQAVNKPSVFVQASGIGFYGTSQDKTLTEGDKPGHDFLAKLSIEWEASSQPVEALGVRRVIIRNGIVLSTRSGALPSLLLPYRFWVGGKLGDGKQVYSWIHILDEVRMIQFLIQNEAAKGVFNLTSPNPLTNDEFGKVVGKVMHRPHYFSIPGFAMKLALGEVASMVLEGQRVIPKKLLDLGFQFRFPTLEAALENLLYQSDNR